jgi:mRNA interferase RelE/StbE
LVWQIEFSPVIEKEFSKLDPQIAKRVTNFLRNRVAMLDDPRSIGEALTGPILASFGSIASATTESSATFRTAS